MTILQAIILGIVQGLTEFLPVSSSGHLVLTPYVLNWQIPQETAFVFNVLVQVGTLVGVIVYFWADLWAIFKVMLTSFWKPAEYSRKEFRLGLYLILATIPAAVVGMLFKSQVKAAFSNPSFTLWTLLFTALLLIVSELVGKRTRQLDSINWWDALLIGLFQIMALFPGVSRSGATITGGMFRNFDRPTAARFSFLMSVPVMLGAGLLSTLDLLKVPNLGDFIGPMAVGFITAGVVGYLSIRWLLRYLTSHPLYYFSIYLIILDILVRLLK